MAKPMSPKLRQEVKAINALNLEPAVPKLAVKSEERISALRKRFNHGRLLL